jgi:hypothetical protein
VLAMTASTVERINDAMPNDTAPFSATTSKMNPRNAMCQLTGIVIPIRSYFDEDGK